MIRLVVCDIDGVITKPQITVSLAKDFEGHLNPSVSKSFSVHDREALLYWDILIGNERQNLEGKILKAKPENVVKLVFLTSDYGQGLEITKHYINKIIDTNVISPNIEFAFTSWDKKAEKLKEICIKHKVSPLETAYIGDGLVDLECMISKEGGAMWCFTPSDASPYVKRSMVKLPFGHILSVKGGCGVLSEVISRIRVMRDKTTGLTLSTELSECPPDEMLVGICHEVPSVIEEITKADDKLNELYED